MANKGHGFQDERSRALTPADVRRVPRDVDQRVQSSYRGPGPSFPLAGPNAPPTPQAEITALRRQSNFYQQSFDYGVVPILLLPAAQRTYFFAQNLSAAQTLYLGFNFVPSGAPPRGVMLVINGGWYEPYQVPQDDIWLVGTGAGTASIIVGLPA